jgi:leucyl aminopeptidase
MILSLSTRLQPRHAAVLAVFSRKKGLAPAAGSGFSFLLSQAREDGFTAKIGDTLVCRPTDRRPAGRVLLVGLGPREEADAQSYRLAAAAVVRRLAEARWREARFLLPEGPLAPDEGLRALAEGALLAGYRFDKFKSERGKLPGLSSLVFVARRPIAGGDGLLGRAALFVKAVDFARDLINEPPSDKTPAALARAARSLAGRSVTVAVHGPAALRRLGARALLGVSRGSAHPPALVHLRYRPRGRAKTAVAFVGKGVTFDSGGLSLKPADGMMTMKYDMAGAAVVLSLFKVLPLLAPSVEVHGVAALTENMPGPDAVKPGDVLRAMNGKTIEVLNTDAEGRLILADALSFAARLPVARVVDVATLTGAATVALGKAYAALLTDTPALEEDLRRAGDEAGEKLWPLPLEISYEEHIRSKVADCKNIGRPGEAGTIIGGLFLKQFAGGKPWAHVDMAGVGWNGKGSPLSPPGATGALARTFLHYILSAGKRP